MRHSAIHLYGVRPRTILQLTMEGASPVSGYLRYVLHYMSIISISLRLIYLQVVFYKANVLCIKGDKKCWT